MDTDEQRPLRYVLFVCNHNAGRSQMAQAFFERDGPEDVRSESAGSEPAHEVSSGISGRWVQPRVAGLALRPPRTSNSTKIYSVIRPLPYMIG
jgi:Low molecular weight phosphotyrosine protein phosphatase